VIGPPKSVSFDPAGKLTRAGEGFAQKYGIPIEKLSVVATPKGEYLAAQQVIPGDPQKRFWRKFFRCREGDSLG